MSCAPLGEASPKVFTVSVGKLSCSKAECFVHNLGDVEALLAAIANRT